VLTVLLAVAMLAATIWPVSRLGSEFMPMLNEGTLLYMPVTLPGLSVTKAAELLQTQDRIIKSFPEVESVFGKAGRANTATDPAPVEMTETVINLKPENEWPPSMTIEALQAQMDEALRLPGVSNAWTMPIKARIDMLSTGIRTPIGIKVFGPDLQEIVKINDELERVLRTQPHTRSVYAERELGGFFLDVTPDREAIARYGLSVRDVLDVVESSIGGMDVVSGRIATVVTAATPLPADGRGRTSAYALATMSFDRLKRRDYSMAQCRVSPIPSKRSDHRSAWCGSDTLIACVFCAVEEMGRAGPVVARSCRLVGPGGKHSSGRRQSSTRLCRNGHSRSHRRRLGRSGRDDLRG
jgi:hypothetical protein